MEVTEEPMGDARPRDDAVQPMDADQPKDTEEDAEQPMDAEPEAAREEAMLRKAWVHIHSLARSPLYCGVGGVFDLKGANRNVWIETYL